MIDDMFVIDAIVHPFNLDRENENGRNGEILFNLLYEGIHGWNPPSQRLPRELFQTNQTAEMLTNSLFRETDVDIAVNHSLPLYAWYKDGQVGREKNIEMAERWPDRWISFATCDPTKGLEVSLKEIAEQVAENPRQLTGLKMYPAQAHATRPGLDHSFRMDDEELMFPIYEKCEEYGFRTVGIHKALPAGPIAMNPFRVEDVDRAAGSFPNLNFEIVHAGLAFIDEVSQAIARYPNVYANLENSFMLIAVSPGWFEDIIAKLAWWGGYEKIVFASGMTQMHAQLLLDLFIDFSYSHETMEKYGLAQITAADKALILGLNYARMIDLDVEAAKAKIADDEFSRYQQENGRDEPWSNWKAMEPELADHPLPEFPDGRRLPFGTPIR